MISQAKNISQNTKSCISVELFNKADIYKLKLWGEHEDLRFIQYDFARFPDDKSFQKWFEIKNRKNKLLFSIKQENEIRGFISLRNIKKFNRSAVMGISIDPNYLSCGIGKLAMPLFFDMYFTKMNMNTLNLKVSNFNERAKALYEKMGFSLVKSRLEKFENQLTNFDLLLYYEDFTQIGEFIYTEVSTYKLTKERYLKNLNI